MRGLLRGLEFRRRRRSRRRSRIWRQKHQQTPTETSFATVEARVRGFADRHAGHAADGAGGARRPDKVVVVP